jgi:hypothetical protein
VSAHCHTETFDKLLKKVIPVDSAQPTGIFIDLGVSMATYVTQLVKKERKVY